MLAEDFLKELKEVYPNNSLLMIIDSYDMETVQRIANQFDSIYEFIIEVENL